MDTKILSRVLMALVVVVSGLVGYAVGMNRPYMAMHRMEGGDYMKDSSMGMHDEMDGMMSSLSGKTGDDLDKAFLSEMIVHHEGAVEMAQLVRASGKHPELKQLADAIIAAQTTEIAQMKTWQAAWYSK